LTEEFLHFPEVEEAQNIRESQRNEWQKNCVVERACRVSQLHLDERDVFETFSETATCLGLLISSSGGKAIVCLKNCDFPSDVERILV
jgi:hypothetical protein